MNLNINNKFNFFKPRKKTNIEYQPSAPPEYNFQYLNDKNMVCWWKTLF